MAETVLYATNGSELGKVELSDEVLGKAPNEGVVHQVVVAQQANLRQGDAATKERSNVAGSTRKLWRQKGTGRARVGSGKAPHWRGGGTAFGPHPRDFSQGTNRKVRREALRSVIADRLATDNLVVLNELPMDKPKTSELVAILKRLNIDGSCLIVTEGADKNAHLSSRNIPGVEQTFVDSLGALDVISHRKLLMTKSALETLEKKLS